MPMISYWLVKAETWNTYLTPLNHSPFFFFFLPLVISFPPTPTTTLSSPLFPTSPALGFLQEYPDWPPWCHSRCLSIYPSSFSLGDISKSHMWSYWSPVKSHRIRSFTDQVQPLLILFVTSYPIIFQCIRLAEQLQTLHVSIYSFLLT